MSERSTLHKRIMIYTFISSSLFGFLSPVEILVLCLSDEKSIFAVLFLPHVESMNFSQPYVITQPKSQSILSNGLGTKLLAGAISS